MKLTQHEVLLIVAGFGLALVAFYAFQVGNRMPNTLAYRIKRVLVGMPTYLAVVYICRERGYQVVTATVAGLVTTFIAARILAGDHKPTSGRQPSSPPQKSSSA